MDSPCAVCKSPSLRSHYSDYPIVKQCSECKVADGIVWCERCQAFAKGIYPKPKQTHDWLLELPPAAQVWGAKAVEEASRGGRARCTSSDVPAALWTEDERDAQAARSPRRRGQDQQTAAYVVTKEVQRGGLSVLRKQKARMVEGVHRHKARRDRDEPRARYATRSAAI